MTPGAKRLAVAHLKDAHDVSERRACTVLNIDRSTVRYRSRRGDDADLRKAIRRISSDRRRFGYRRIHVMLRREGFEVYIKKVRRMTRELSKIATSRGLPETIVSDNGTEMTSMAVLK